MKRTRGRGLEREIDRACITALAYDAQTESDRAEWLYELASIAGRLDALRPRMLRSLRTAAPQRHSWSSLQRLELAAFDAQNGESASRDAVLRFFAHSVDEFANHANDAVLVAAGRDGFEFALRALARADQFDRNALGALTRAATEHLGKRTTQRVLRDLSGTVRELARLHAVRSPVERRRSSSRLRAARWSDGELERRLTDRRATPPYVFWRWARTAPKRTLTGLDRRIVRERNARTLERLFAVFRERPMVRGIPRALDAALSRKSSLSNAALVALAATKDPRARGVALGRIESGPVSLTASSIAIIAQQPRATDWRLINRRVARARDIHTVHAIGSVLIEWARSAPMPNSRCALAWVWDNTPCSHCRASALQLLRNRRARIPGRLIQEALHDASPNVRKIAARLRKRAIRA